MGLCVGNSDATIVIFVPVLGGSRFCKTFAVVRPITPAPMMMTSCLGLADVEDAIAVV